VLETERSALLKPAKPGKAERERKETETKPPSEKADRETENLRKQRQELLVLMEKYEPGFSKQPQNKIDNFFDGISAIRNNWNAFVANTEGYDNQFSPLRELHAKYPNPPSERFIINAIGKITTQFDTDGIFIMKNASKEEFQYHVIYKFSSL